jgi:hypothetical protein
MTAPELLRLGRREVRRWWYDQSRDDFIETPVHVIDVQMGGDWWNIAPDAVWRITFECGLMYVLESTMDARGGWWVAATFEGIEDAWSRTTTSAADEPLADRAAL